MRTRAGNLFLIIPSLIIAICLSSFFSTNNVNAVDRPANLAEEQALDLCTNGPRGVIWFNTPSSSYFDDIVNVSSTENSVDVTIRGSFYSCNFTGPYPTTLNAWYINYVNAPYPNKKIPRLSSPDPRTVLYRGQADKKKQFSSGDDRTVSAVLDVSGLAMDATHNDDYKKCNILTSYCQSIIVSLYRCPVTAEPPDRECYSSKLTINVVREKPEWSISATSESSVNGSAYSGATQTAKPGDKIVWRHNLINSGSDTTDRVYSRLEVTGIPEWPSGTDLDGAFTEAGQPVGVIRKITGHATYNVRPRDVGNILCEQIQFQRMDNLSSGAGNTSCVSIPLSYILTPSVTVNQTHGIEPGTSFNITPAVDNSGPTQSIDTQWQLTQTIVTPNNIISNPNGGISDIEPCTYFRNPNADCSVVNRSSNNIFNVGKILLSVYQNIAGDLVAGTRICFALSVQPYSNISGQWSHSAPVCMVIGKKPKVQIWGGDLWARGDVKTSTSVKNIGGTDRTFGSWDEYGTFSARTIIGMASGSAFADPLTGATTVCKYSTLSFTNVATGGTSCADNGVIGKYANSRSIPDVAASFPISASTLSISPNLNGLASGVYKATANTAITGGNIAKGQWIVINATGVDITISGNITYNNGPFSSLADIPQVVIIANNINISDGVTKIDAWLIAKGSINTCSSVASDAKLTVNMCNQSLVINGPVMANKLYLRRTAGSGTGLASGVPAETFNLRADAYLWAAARSTTNGKIQTVYTTELPPRF